MVDQADDVGVVELTEDFGLLLEGFEFDFGVGDYFYSEEVLVVIDGTPEEDAGGCTLAEFLKKIIFSV